MKFIVSLMCFLGLATLVQPQSPLHSISRPCKKANNCQEQLLHLLGRIQIPQSQECFCAMGCIAQQTGMFRGTSIDALSLASFLRTEMYMDQTKATTVATTCSRATVTGTNPWCDSAKALLTCVKNNA